MEGKRLAVSYALLKYASNARTPLIISGPIPKGDIHEFNELKPLVSDLVSKQNKYLNAQK